MSVSPLPATAPTAVDPASRAAAELAEFQDRQAEDDASDGVDPDAPAAMKDSPSVSGENGECQTNHLSTFHTHHDFVFCIDSANGAEHKRFICIIGWYTSLHMRYLWYTANICQCLTC